jgi:hypothetical protein
MNRLTPGQRTRFYALVIAGMTVVTLALLFLGGCAAGAPAATATPTKTRMPTFTPAPPTDTPTVPPLDTATATEAPPTATLEPTATQEPSATPEPPTATAEPPTATARPAAAKLAPRPVQPTAPPPPPAAADPCANIGGDGCKFHVTGGPSFAENGGLELKLQLAFIHSGIEGGQPQSSYFVVLEKDGVKLPVPDSVRSGPGVSQGSQGRYNYEYAMGVDKLPGNTVAGNYRMYVLDGNGERDSRDLNFSLGGNQGLVWVQWDQG